MTITRDSLILRITQGGDPLSWEEFYSIYQPFLLGVVKRWGIKDQDASDIVQDVFVTLVRALPQFEFQSEKGRFRGWLKTVVRNATVDWFRRRGRSREVSLDVHPTAKDVLSDDLDWDTVYRTQVLSFAIQRVKEDSQAATWYCFEEHILRRRKAADVGEECGLNSGAVYVNASRVLARIRRKCEAFDTELAIASPSERSSSDPGRGASSSTNELVRPCDCY